MPQLFPPSVNTICRVVVAGVFVAIAGLVWLPGALDRSGWVTRTGFVRDQPIPFSHKLHCGGLGIDCRHCHTTVERSAFAGMPSTKTCIHCHSQIFADAPVLEPLRASFRDDTPIAWVRVADLPDFVYFDHGIHVLKGFGCVTCHGRVDRMPLVSQAVSMSMRWCLECHRDPGRFVRPRREIYSMTWTPENQEALGRRLVEDYKIRRVTDCSACHR
jgi:hypothetical protein